MKTAISLKVLALAALGLAASAQAECGFPKAPASVPDGKTATSVGAGQWGD